MSDNSINDPVFGALRKRFSTWRREIDQSLYGFSRRVELIVESNNATGEIFPEQRESYVDFRAREAEIVALLESSIDEYVNDICRESGIRTGETSKHVQLTGIVFPMVLSAGERSIGFLLECDFDLENGIGIKITNGQINIGYQDIIT